MRTIKNTLVIVLALTLVSFTTSLIEKEVKVKDSKITWTGYKVTGQHEGTITLKEGTLTFDAKKLVKTNFTIDMTTINTTDLEGGSKGKLDGHLKSADFFDVAAYPTASFTSTSISGDNGNYNVTGNLTIKDKTNPITFNMTQDGKTVNAKLKIDRSEFNVKYGSPSFFEGLKDKAIYDEFDLNVNLSF